MKQFLKDRNVFSLYKRHPHLIAYLFIVVATLGGFFSVNRVIHKQNLDRIAGRKVSCLVLNQTREGLNQFVVALEKVSQQNPPTATTTPEQKERTEKAIETFNSLIKPATEHVDCVLFVQHPEESLKQEQKTSSKTSR